MMRFGSCNDGLIQYVDSSGVSFFFVSSGKSESHDISIGVVDTAAVPRQYRIVIVMFLLVTPVHV